MRTSAWGSGTSRLVVALATALLAVAASPCDAQDADAQTFRREHIELTGSHAPSGASYTLDVLLPPEYDSASAGLPVLYYLDAWWWGQLLESLYRMSALATPARVAPVILVGITVTGDADSFNRSRNRDFTPSPYQPIAPGVTMRTGNVILDSAGTGGAREFLAFLEREVIPAVGRRYRVLAGERGIAGHSYGGLFAAWVQRNRPQVFQRYLLVSPSTYWNDSEVLQHRPTEATEASRKHRIFIGTGSTEMHIMRRSGEELLSAVEAAGLDASGRVYAGADHLTVLPRALLDGLTYLYPP